jgi:hypothetical protein
VILAEPITPPSDVHAWAFRYAGAHPASRDAVDTRILSRAINGTSRIINDPSESGGLAGIVSARAPAPVPAEPFAPSTIGGMLRIEAWLCERHLEVGGPPTPECAHPRDAYRSALRSQVSQRR